MRQNKLEWRAAEQGEDWRHQANQPRVRDPGTEPGKMCLHHFNWNNDKNPQQSPTLKCGLLRLPLMRLTWLSIYSNYFETFPPSKLPERQDAWAGFCLTEKWASNKRGTLAHSCWVPTLSLSCCSDSWQLEHNSLLHLCRQEKYFSFYTGETNVLETCMWYYCLRPKLPMNS